jgi:DNA-binding response OmpR family regulator
MEQRTRKKILIADDDAGILDALTLFLEEVGYEVEATDDGAVLRTFPDGMPDLLLLDIWMSGWNGRDICHHLKSQEATRHLPVILMSANRDTAIIAREVRADDFLAKPFDLDALLEKIEQYV